MLPLKQSAKLPTLYCQLQLYPPSLNFTAAPGEAAPLWLSHSCWTLMRTCLRSFHWPPLATSPLKMTSCCLPVVSLVLDYRWEVGERGRGMERSVVHFKPHFFLHSHLFFFFPLPLWLLPLYIDKMSCIWKMISGRNTEFLLGMCI